MRAWMWLAMVVPGAAYAQDGFDGHTWQLAAPIGDGRDAMLFPRPGRMTAMRPTVAGLFEYAKDPVLVTSQVGGGDVNVNRVLANVVALNVAAGFAVHERVRFDLSAPVYFASTGLETQPSPSNPAPASVAQGFGLGDIRLGALANILMPGDNGGLGVGVAPYLDLPTGNDAKFLGQGGIAGGGKLVGTFETGPLVVNAAVGPRFNPGLALSNLPGGTTLDLGLGLGVVTSNLGVHGELRMVSPLAKVGVPGTATPAELLLYGRFHTSGGGHAMVGGSFAVTPGASASTFRLFVGGGFGNPRSGEPVPKLSDKLDTDMDGLADAIDKCPEKKETKNQYNDDDGCPDKLAKTQVSVLKDDQIAAEIEVTLEGPSGTKTITSDYVPVLLDLIPGIYKVQANVSGMEALSDVELFEGQNAVVADLFPSTPSKVSVTVVDQKGKPVPNARVTFRGTRATDEEWSVKPDGTVTLDAKAGSLAMFVLAPGLATWRQDVKLEPGKSYEFTAKLGGEQVRVTQNKVEILETVYFDTNLATIKSESFPLLDEVTNSILTDRSIVRIEVSGHTDNVGDPAANLKLSQDRAQAVVDYIVKHGVDPRKIAAVGYGQTKPIAKNNTETGRAQNRRVEFVITERRAARPGAK
jgi:OOP family OmpA-OmpF porin